MSTKGPDEADNVINNHLIKMAVEKIKSLPIPAPIKGQTDYKEEIIQILTAVDKTNFIESDKESGLIEMLNGLLEDPPIQLKNFTTQFSDLLTSLQTEQAARFTKTTHNQPKKSLLKNDTRKRSLNQMFDLESNTERQYLLEDGRKLNYNTKAFREEERQKYQAKRTPDEQGASQLKQYGNHPPVNNEAEYFEGGWLSRASMQEVEEYFDELGDFESSNITRNQDGTYLLTTFTENDKNRGRSVYNQTEMNDIIAGFSLQKQLCDLLHGDERGAKFRYYTRAYQTTLDLYSPDEREITSMIAALRSLNMQISEPDKYEGVQRVCTTMEEIHKVLNEHPYGFFLPLGAAYHKALEAASDSEDVMLHDFAGTTLADSGDAVLQDLDGNPVSEFSDIDLSDSDDEVVPDHEVETPAKPKP